MTGARGTVTATGMAGETATIGRTTTEVIGGTVTAMTANGKGGMTLIVGTTTVLVRRTATSDDGSTRAIEIMTAVETEMVTDGREGMTMSGTGVTGGGRQCVLGAEQRVT